MTTATTAAARLEPVVAIFEGGGAKGITHIGALKALEQTGLDMILVAGSSAGAIVAALAAIGVRADRIYTAGRHLLDEHEHDAVTLLGEFDWRCFDWLRRRGLLLALVLLYLWLMWQAWVWPLALPLTLRLALVLAGLALLVAVTLLALMRYFACRGPWRLVTRFGFFDGEAVRDVVDQILRDEIRRQAEGAGEAPPEMSMPLRFADIEPRPGGYFIPLKISVTDLATRQLLLIDRSYPDAAVADAIVASLSIPLVFPPAAIRGLPPDLAGHRFLDGGLVANLPTWVFNTEKRAVERGRPDEPPVPILAFGLDDAAADDRMPVALGAYLLRVLRTGVFGSQTLARRLVADVFPVSMVSPLGVLAFDCERAAATLAYDAGRNVAADRLQRQLIDAPATARARLEAFLAAALARSHALRDRLGEPRLPQLRAAIVCAFGTSAFRVEVAAGMVGDADDRLLLDVNAPGAPEAWALRDATYAAINPAPQRPYMTKYERALVRQTLAAMIAVPMFRDPEMWLKAAIDRDQPDGGVLVIDSDASLDIEYDDNEFMQRLVEASVDLVDVASLVKDRDL